MLKNLLHWELKPRSLLPMWKGSCFLKRITTAKTTLTACANTVANAAPAASMQTGNQNEVADDVDDTCDEDEQERRFAVAKSAENRRQQVVGDDEENTAAADTNITCRQSDCFSRSLHEYRDGAGKESHRCEQADRKQRENNRRAADDGADLFRVLFPEITGDQDGDAHCELCHNKGDEV